MGEIMKITRNGIEKLGPYYERIANAASPCDPTDKTKCCSFSPYTKKETINEKLLPLENLF